MRLITKLRGGKDHFVITIYKEDRANLNCSVGDIVIFKLNNKEFIRPIRKDYHISLPKIELKNKIKGDKIILPLLKIAKKKDCVKRPKDMAKNGKLDIRYFIPEKTIFGHPIYIIKRNKDYSSIWYPVGGGAKQINIKNFIDVDKTSELIGFYFGDGSTSKKIRSFRLTNSQSSVLNYCLSILKEIGIKRKDFKIQVIYSTDSEVTKDIKIRCIDFWSKILGINKDRVISVNKSKNVRETLKYGSARIYVDSSILVEVMLHGLLNGILCRILNPQNRIDKILLNGFMRGLLAAEGSPELNKNNSLIRIGISYDPHSNELDIYKTLLYNLDINYGKTHRNALYIYKHDNFQKMYQIEAFKMHKSRNQKFIDGFRNHKYSKINP